MKHKKQTAPAVNPAWIKPHLATLSGIASALYDQAEEMGGGCLAEKMESFARKLNAVCHEIENKAPAVNPANKTAAAALAVIIGVLAEAIENNREQKRFAADPEIYDTLANELKELNTALAWAKANAACPGKAATVTQLENELRRRGCAVAVITPEDVLEQWKVNQDADETDEPEPTQEETAAALRTIGAELADCLFDNYGAGPTSEACELIAAWRKEGKSK
jgi:hypothetical protein